MPQCLQGRGALAVTGTTRRTLVSGFLKYVLENRVRPECVAVAVSSCANLMQPACPIRLPGLRGDRDRSDPGPLARMPPARIGYLVPSDLPP